MVGNIAGGGRCIDWSLGLFCIWLVVAGGALDITVVEMCMEMFDCGI